MPRKNGIDITGEPERLKGDVNLVKTGAIGFLFFLKITWSSEIFGGFIGIVGVINISPPDKIESKLFLKILL